MFNLMHWLKVKGLHTARRQKEFDKFSLFGLEIKFMLDKKSEQKMVNFIEKKLSI